MKKKIKGFKAFDKSMKCRGFQFKEGKTYSTKNARICQEGFHFCTNPLDILSYYGLCESSFHEVEGSGKVDTHKQDSKHAVTKIKIGARLSLKSFVEASVDFLLKICKVGENQQKNDKKDYARLASSGDYARLASSGYSAQLASSGHYAQLASSGHYAQLASSGDSARLASSGYYAQLASSGDYARLASSGYYAQLASSGYYAQLASSGDYARLASSGDSARLASSGDYARLELNGKDNIGVAIASNSKIKGKKDNWITLSEWTYDENKGRYIPVYVKSAQIDGKKLKEDTWYMLKDKEFVEVN